MFIATQDIIDFEVSKKNSIKGNILQECHPIERPLYSNNNQPTTLAGNQKKVIVHVNFETDLISK